MIRRVGVVMHNKYYWVDVSITLYLVIDNAGGIGTNECVTEYTNMLARKHKNWLPANYDVYVLIASKSLFFGRKCYIDYI